MILIGLTQLSLETLEVLKEVSAQMEGRASQPSHGDDD